MYDLPFRDCASNRICFLNSFNSCRILLKLNNSRGTKYRDPRVKSIMEQCIQYLHRGADEVYYTIRLDVSITIFLFTLLFSFLLIYPHVCSQDNFKCNSRSRSLLGLQARSDRRRRIKLNREFRHCTSTRYLWIPYWTVASRESLDLWLMAIWLLVYTRLIKLFFLCFSFIHVDGECIHGLRILK